MNDDAPPGERPLPSVELPARLSVLSGPALIALAAASDCTVNHLYNVRRGAVKPGLALAERIFAALGTPLVTESATDAARAE